LGRNRPKKFKNLKETVVLKILQKGEEKMETLTKEGKETIVKEEKKGMPKGLRKFLNFLAYGGWLLLVVFILAIIILISVLTT
jgi:hypothetical protein